MPASNKSANASKAKPTNKKTTAKATAASTASTKANKSKPASKKATIDTAPHVTYTASKTPKVKLPSVGKPNIKAAGQRTKKTVASRKFWYVVAGIFGSLVVALVMWWQWQRSYVVVVNGQYMSADQLDSQLRANYAAQGVDALVQQQLILQEAAHQNITPSAAEIDERMQRIVESSGGQDRFQAQLSQLGISENFLRQQVEVQLLREELLKDKVAVTDEEIQKYYDENKSYIDPEGTQGVDGLRQSITDTLKQQKLESESEAYLESLKGKSVISEHLDHLSLSFPDFVAQLLGL